MRVRPEVEPGAVAGPGLWMCLAGALVIRETAPSVLKLLYSLFSDG